MVGQRGRLLSIRRLNQFVDARTGSHFLFRQSRQSLLTGISWPYLAHMLLGMTIFLLFPFSRLVHVWSGFASVAYLFRPYQVVRSRRLNLPAGHNTPPLRH